MALYAFQLGRIPELGLAELHALLPETPPIAHDAEIAVLDLPQIENAQELLDRCGGIVRIMIVERAEEDTIRFTWEDTIRTIAKDAHRKLSFGISRFGGCLPRERSLTIPIKQTLRSEGLSLRAVDGEQILSTGAVIHNKLVGHGVELVGMNVSGQSFAGHTIAIQDIEEYTIRDMNKPARDMKRGMLPPKLAQVMINCSQVPAGGTILDPFCGIGTTMMEGMLMGIECRGSDNDERAVRESKLNIAWLQKTYPRTKDLSVQIHLCDARALRTCWKEPVDAIVTEGTLGPMLTRELSPSRMHEIHGQLVVLYREFFLAAVDMVKPGGKIVISIPYYRVHGERVEIPHGELMNAFGAAWEIQPLLRHTSCIYYDRPDQFVGRSIWRLRRKVSDFQRRTTV